MHYILNKYINHTKPDDYIESYELSIIRLTDRFMDSAYKCLKMMPQMDKPELENVSEEEKVLTIAHIFSAMHLFEVLLIALPVSQREQWFEKIENPFIKEGIKEGIQNKIKRHLS